MEKDSSKNEVDVDLEENLLLIYSENPRKWPLQLFECFAYRDIKGNTRWFPSFCPKALFCSNSLAGSIHSKLQKENVICLGLGAEGICCCLSLCPFAMYSPTGGLGVFCLATNYLRQQTIKKYNVIDDDICSCPISCVNPFCNFCLYGLNYPCTLFQIQESIEYWDKEDSLSLSSSNDIVLANNVRSF